MATDPSSPFRSTLSSEAKKEMANEHTNIEYKRFMKYQGFWIPKLFITGVNAVQQQFKARPTDILLASTLKSGTTWARALMFTALTRKDHPLDRHPILHTNPHYCFPFLEGKFNLDGGPSLIDALPPPRLLATHIPYSMLPDSVAASNCPIVYLCRDHKDVLVSAWHFFTANKIRLIPLSEMFEEFCAGFFSYGPTWEHNLEYWNTSLERPQTVLFLKYEDMMEDPEGTLRRLADFMGCPFTEEEVDDGVVGAIVRLCSFEKLASLDVNKMGDADSRLIHQAMMKNSPFFRKGKVGDWVNYMSADMGRTIDDITRKKLQGSGLTMPGVVSEDP